MKKKSLLAVLLSLVIIVAMTACSSAPKTIEEYVENDKEAQEQVQSAADQSGLAVDFSGNDVIYTYDLSTIENVTEEVAKSDLMVEQLSAALQSTEGTFSNLCEQLEKESKIEGVQIVVNYTYGDEVIVSKTFNSSGVVE